MSAEDIDKTKPQTLHKRIERLYSSLDARDIKGAIPDTLFKSIDRGYDSMSNEDIAGTKPVPLYKNTRNTYCLQTKDIKGSVSVYSQKYLRAIPKNPLESFSENPLGQSGGALGTFGPEVVPTKFIRDAMKTNDIND